ncbi:MAG: DMT family transporter [Acetobacteraceae bacterium]|nr:DMT family transporter [Acetobacteraceae bacterium]
MLPGIVAALSFSVTDILLKLVYADGMDVLSLVTLRGALVVVLFWLWMKLQKPRHWHQPRQRNIALVLGLLFAAVMFGLLLSVSLLPVSIAILAYFVYPLLTGIGAALTGVEKLGWRALLTAFAAFGGLSLMLGVDLASLSTMGLACAFGAALCRVVSLLATRAYLAGTDARVTTWYSLVPSTALFIVASALFGVWHLPQTHIGWLAFLGISFGSTLSTLLIYISTNRVGPFRTALVMNLEPLVTAILSMIFLGEIMTPTQMFGGAIMLCALCVFQFVRGK